MGEKPDRDVEKVYSIFGVRGEAAQACRRSGDGRALRDTGGRGRAYVPARAEFNVEHEREGDEEEIEFQLEVDQPVSSSTFMLSTPHPGGPC